MFGYTELLVILVILLLVFGVRRIPALGRSFGLAFKEFKRAKSDNEIDVTESSRKANLREKSDNK